ncbi:acriflavin resistance protein [Syntrophobotulus glycolicus DSM 8271]|uniref:Acriflavin resistance protein n=1 Tax=Syntrophobotulus glycolicus (strain DSM 8271 / FlGlyR) TaxID=645991 RepID=F0SWN0_SYNGF|nr:efflux RND transporter permease subunit [Syntrophobotulus glycolicus]ADY56870.1 acriflavin resistance protein [Syntrophobotulus glycolicus DSM 8271]
MRISESSVKRPVTVLMCVLIVIILGIVSYTRIPLDLLPDMDIPVAVVSTSYQGVGPQEVEKLVTKPLEQAVGTVQNLKTISSSSSEGSSLIIVQFNYGVDMNNAALDLREKVDLVKGALPDDVSSPMVFKFDPTSMPILTLSLSSEGKSLSELQKLAEDTVKPRLERAEGVASVDVRGGTEDIVEIRTKAEKMQGYGISLDTLAGILKAENLNLPGGDVQKGSQKLTVKTTGEFSSVDDIKQLLVPLGNGANIQLMDIADVELKPDEQTTISKANGKPSINISLMKQSGSNTVKVSEAAQAEIAGLEKELDGVNITLVNDSADYVKKSLNQVFHEGMVGGLLAVLILYLFLRNVRTTLIIATSIPISIIATFSILYFSDITLNMMTLGGLALGMGRLVDDSVVVLENIYRFRQNGYSRTEAAVKGSSEVIVAVMASTLTTLAVFLPIVFVQGLTSTLFKQFALTVSFSLAASLVVAVTLVPMLAAKLLKINHQDKAPDGEDFDVESMAKAEGGMRPPEEKPARYFLRIRGLFNKAYAKFDQGYESLLSVYKDILAWSLTHRVKVVLFTTVFFFLCMSSLAFVGSEFMPQSDEGYVQVTVTLPDGSKVENTAAFMNELEGKMENVQGIDTVFIEAGSAGESGLVAAKGNTGTMNVKLVPLAQRRGVQEITDEIRRLIQDTPGAELKVAPLQSMSMGDAGEPISIILKGEELETLKEVADDVVGIVKGVPGTREVKSSYEDGIPEVEISVNRQAASQYGLTAGQIASTVRASLAGTTATSYKYDGTEIDVVIRGDENFKQNIQALEQIPINNTAGNTVSLNQVADISIKRGPVSIARQDQVRTVTVSSQLSGRDVGSVSTDIQKALDTYQMPDRYTYEMTGQQKEMMDAFGDLGLALILAVLLVYMVMASQFESLLYPFVIMFSMPIGFAGGILGLFLTGKSLSVNSIIGLIMLAGIVVSNAIVLVDYINTRRKVYHEDRNTAIIKAGPIRLRPILMTALATILAMLPMALGVGEGAELQAPLAIVVVFGLTLSTVVTLVLIPVMYTLFDDFSNKVKGMFFSGKGGDKTGDSEKPAVAIDPGNPVQG